MNTQDLKKLALHARHMRETGIALLIASCILAIFSFIQPAREQFTSASVTTEISKTPNAFAEIFLEAKAAVVYDLAAGKILYAKNANAQLPLASLTKLLTVYAALNELVPDTLVTIPDNIASVDGPLIFSAGQTFSLSDLARLTLTASLNDGAAAIANATASRKNRSENEMLASAATALDLSQTYAINSNGLDVNGVVSGGYGSALDVARLAGAIVELAPHIAEATTQSFARAVSTDGTPFSVKNTNPMINTVPRLLLSKTGYTDLAGGNLALVFDAGMRHPIAIVVLGSSMKARFTDSSALLSSTLAHLAGVASL